MICDRDGGGAACRGGGCCKEKVIGTLGVTKISAPGFETFDVGQSARLLIHSAVLHTETNADLAGVFFWEGQPPRICDMTSAQAITALANASSMTTPRERRSHLSLPCDGN